MTTEVIDLKPFCCDNDRGRYNLAEPWFRNGRRIASDTAVMITIDAAGEPDTEGNFPSDAEILKGAPVDGYQPWPAANYIYKLQKCRKCKGSGYAHFRDCVECDGSGETVCGECGHEDECEECDGEGVMGCGRCEECDGTKETNQPSYTMVGNLAIAAKYDLPIRDLPNVSYAQVGEMTFFRFDGGGLGCVMPLDISRHTP